ncbi:MAG: hypothetical protein HRT87_02190 [Legionellales bacterium]|nr:hypothetical protein [Legionellales bacterium]
MQTDGWLIRFCPGYFHAMVNTKIIDAFGSAFASVLGVESEPSTGEKPDLTFFSLDTSIIKQYMWKNGFNFRWGIYLLHITDFRKHYGIAPMLSFGFGMIF